jgi:hypothetical protein
MENKSLMESHVLVRKVNKTRSLVGYAITHEPFGNDIIVEALGLKKQGELLVIRFYLWMYLFEIVDP